MANALWGQDGYPFVAQYQDLLAQNYGSEVMPIDFKQGAKDKSTAGLVSTQKADPKNRI